MWSPLQRSPGHESCGCNCKYRVFLLNKILQLTRAQLLLTWPHKSCRRAPWFDADCRAMLFVTVVEVSVAIAQVRLHCLRPTSMGQSRASTLPAAYRRPGSVVWNWTNVHRHSSGDRCRPCLQWRQKDLLRGGAKIEIMS